MCVLSDDESISSIAKTLCEAHSSTDRWINGFILTVLTIPSFTEMQLISICIPKSALTDRKKGSKNASLHQGNMESMTLPELSLCEQTEGALSGLPLSNPFYLLMGYDREQTPTAVNNIR